MEINLIINGNSFPYSGIASVNIYDAGKVLFSTSRHIERYSDQNGVYGSDSFVSLQGIELANAPKRANKLNLNRKDNFIVKVPTRYSFEDCRALYIHVSEVQVIDNGEKIAHQTKEETNYLHAYTLSGRFVVRVPHYEFIPEREGLKMPENYKYGECFGSKEAPCYHFQEFKESRFSKRKPGKYVVVKWLENEEIAELPTAAPYYCKTEYSERRLEAKRIAEELNTKRVFYNKVSFYEIEKLMDIYNLSAL